MKIATWNINGMRARLDFIIHWLRATRPDVVGLQELKLTDDKFPHAELEAEGYKAITHGQKSWNGVAILTRETVEATQVGLPGEEEFGARLLSADIGDLSFTTVYCPNGKSVEHADFPKKLAWFDSLAEHFEKNHDPARPTILCGDINICRAGIDSWNGDGMKGAIFHTDEERARVKRLLDWGFIDVYRQKYPDTQEYSWWDYRGGAFHRRMGLRIDLILASPPALDRIGEIQIDREYRKKKDGLTASDHAPVIADFG